MSLVSDIITQSFLDLGAIAPGETISTSEQTDAFTRLNQMLASWSTEQVSVFTRVHQSVSITSAVPTYTLGLAADGATLPLQKRPVRIAAARTEYGPVGASFRYPMKMVSFEEFSDTVPDPAGLTAVLPHTFVYDNGFPLINVRLFPTPNNSAALLWVDYWSAIPAFPTVGETVNMPPGYEDALHFNLALRLSPQYARQNGVDPALVTMAGETKAALVNLNAQILGLTPAPPPVAVPAKA